MAKSKPIGVRFDLYKLDMIQKEQNLTSVQQVVNYLMDNYGKKEPQSTFSGYSANEISSIAANYPKVVAIPHENKKTPPEGLKGIDLVIWKAENWK
jgi:hypothetical protein